MIPALILAALAAGTFAAPHNHKRDLQIVVETETDIVYVYDIVTVTAYDGAVSSSTIASTTSTTTTPTSNVDKPLFHHNFGLPAETSATTASTIVPVMPKVPVPFVATYSSSVAPSVVSSPHSTSRDTTSTDVPSITSIAPPPVVSLSTSAAPPPVSSIVAPATVNHQVTGYNELVLAHHNVHRRNHSAPDLVWDDNLAATAYQIASSCVYAHDVDTNRNTIGGYGQNIAAGVGSDNISMIITELFYNGEVNWYDGLYGQAQPDMSEFEHWGHFSQVVWHDTSKVGCSTYHCENGLANVDNNVPPYFTVCNYQDVGNMAGEYDQVGSPLGQPTIHWDYFN